MEQFSATLAGASDGSFGGIASRCASGTNASNMPTISAVLAAINEKNALVAASNQHLNNEIPSQQSAFAFLRKSASDLCEANSSSMSSFLLQANPAISQQQTLHSNNLFLPMSSSPPSTTNLINILNNSHASNALQTSQQNSSSPTTSNVAAAATMAKLFANAGSNLDVLATLQKYIEKPTFSETSVPSNSNLSFLSSSAKLSELDALQQQQHQQLQHQQRQQQIQQQQKSLLHEDFEQQQMQLHSSIRAALEPHISNSQCQSGQLSSSPTINTSTEQELNPVRRIRRRRPKSPRSIKSIKGSTNPPSYGEQHQAATPDDPVINSPPSFARLHTDTPMTMEETRSSVHFTADMEGEMKLRHKCCLVCGDNATGYNFNVITCESCKAFFRRNALRPKDFKCPYSDECQITIVTRRFCQKCRLRKCFMVGMKKEWILNDDQLKRRKNSRLNNKGQHSYLSPTPSSTSQRSTPTSMSTPMSALSSAFIMSPQTGGIAKHRDEQNLSRINAFFPTTRHSTELPVINPPSAQSSTNLSISLSPEMPTSGNVSNNVLPQIETSDDQYNPNIINIRQSINNQAFTMPAQNTTTIGGVSLPSESSYASSVLSIPSLCSTSSTTINSLSSPESTPPFPSVEALLHRGQPKIALSIEDYQRLVNWKGLNCSTSQAMALLPSSSQYQQTTPQQTQNIMEHMNATSNLSLSTISKSLSHNILAAAGFTANQQPFLQNYFQQQQQQQFNKVISSIKANEEQMFTMQPTVISKEEESHMPSMSLAITSSIPSNSMTTSASNSFNNMGKRSMCDAQAMIEAKRKYMEHTIYDELYNVENTSVYKTLHSPVETPKTNLLQEMLLDDRYRLSPFEANEIELVRKAFRQMDEKLGDAEKHANQTLQKIDHSPVDVLNIMDIPMRRLVKVSKELRTFMELSSEGRLQILRVAMINLLTVRGLLRLDQDQKNFASPVLGQNKVSTKLFEKLKKNLKTNHFFTCYRMIHENVRTDTTAMYLISLVILFDQYHELADERDQQIAKRHREHYDKMLKRYMESIHGDNAGKALETIPAAIQQIYKVSQQAATAFVGLVKPEETEPLPTEFFKTSVPCESDDANEPISVMDELDDVDAPPSVVVSPPPAPLVKTDSSEIFAESSDMELKEDT